MTASITLIGFGEAGRAFAQGWQLPTGHVRAYDIKTERPDTAPEMRSAYGQFGVEGSVRLADALAGSDLVLCLVPAGENDRAAAAAAPLLAAGTCWIDASSSSPGTKKAAATRIEQAGANYVDMAIMAPVHPRLHRTPALLSGGQAPAVRQRLQALGMDVELAGGEIGQASAIKMIRSILVKGLEALTAECFLAARKAGVAEEVLASFRASDPNNDWQARTAYNLERMAVHGTRRAAEMREAVATIAELNLPGPMTAATVQWQENIGAMSLSPGADADFDTQLDAILQQSS